MIETNKPNVIPFKDLINIKKGMIGYVDKEGNFYPISEIEQHNYWVGRKIGLAAGLNARKVLLSLDLTDEENPYPRKQSK